MRGSAGEGRLPAGELPRPDTGDVPSLADSADTRPRLIPASDESPWASVDCRDDKMRSHH